jgi:hypothetical protein
LREAWAVKVTNAINTSRNSEHIETAKAMLSLFEQRFHEAPTLRRWLLDKEFEIYHKH